jgi:uncharacterized protein (TIGR02145 family)
MIFFFASIFISGCKKKDEAETIPVHETGTVTDIDGNVYRTIKIGNQWWMAENLKVKKYRNGNFISTTGNNAEWQDFTTGAYCSYGNSSENSDVYGFLYNWYVISDTGNIAPPGWHIPSDEEWKEMEMSLGMISSEADKSGWRGTHEGEKLKKESPEGWTDYENIWATNETGFTALGGSCRLFNGLMGQPGLKQTGFWWTRSETDSAAFYRYLDYKNATVFRGQCSKNYGFSIRCVKD